jgi:hypothetical protein
MEHPVKLMELSILLGAEIAILLAHLVELATEELQRVRVTIQNVRIPDRVDVLA